MDNFITNKPGRLFVKYALQNVLGLIGMSAYILADTYFISVAAGADGIATLNLVLPVYSLIFAIGAMIGVGGATRYMIATSSGKNRADNYYSNCIIWALLIGALFMLAGIIFPGALLSRLGGDETILPLGTPYLRIILLFAPLFMIEHIVGAFTRNDGAPTVAMVGLLASSLFNVLFDYILMFPLGLGMVGAALATAFSPVIDMCICLTHILSKKNHLRLRLRIPSARLLFHSCQLGIPSFIGEFASGVTTLVFNGLILALAGNNGVAAYGVIANVSIVVIAVFNGIAQGTQPLVSYYFGRGERKKQRLILKYSITASAVFSALVIAATAVYPEQIAGVFDSEGNAAMRELAVSGIPVYFTGMLFAGVNIVGTGYLGAIGNAFWATVISILRGVVAIILFAALLSHFFHMAGIWAAFPATETLALGVTGLAFFKNNKTNL